MHLTVRTGRFVHILTHHLEYCHVLYMQLMAARIRPTNAVKRAAVKRALDRLAPCGDIVDAFQPSFAPASQREPAPSYPTNHKHQLSLTCRAQYVDVT